MQWDCIKNPINILFDFCNNILHLVTLSSELIKFSSYGISITTVKGLFICVVSYPPDMHFL